MRNKIAIFGIFVASFVFVFTQEVSADTTGVILPSSDGTYLDWTTSSGSSTHYTLVDEASSCNGTTDYNYTDTENDRDSYGINFSFVPNGSVITKIEIVPCASKNQNATGTSEMDVFYRWSGVDSADAGNYFLSNGITPVTLATTTFSGLSFTKTATSTLEIGAALKTGMGSGTKGVRLSRIFTVITFTR